jgi:hypothetical protein
MVLDLPVVEADFANRHQVILLLPNKSQHVCHRLTVENRWVEARTRFEHWITSCQGEYLLRFGYRFADREHSLHAVCYCSVQYLFEVSGEGFSVHVGVRVNKG